MCLISAMLVFPAMVAIRDKRRVAPPRLVKSAAAGQSILEALFKRPKLILIFASAITLGVSVFAPRVRFDQNLLKLQAQGSEAVRFENKLLMDSGRSSWFAVSMAYSRDEGENLATKYKTLPQVGNAETIASYIPEQQPEKRGILADIKSLITPIAIKTVHPDPAMLARQLESLRFKLGSAKDSDQSDDVAGEVAKTAALLGRASAILDKNQQAFADCDRAMVANLSGKLETLRRALAPAEVTASNLPKILCERFIGSSGAYLVQVYSRDDIWDDAPLARFISAVRSVDIDVTSPPVQTCTIAMILRRG